MRALRKLLILIFGIIPVLSCVAHPLSGEKKPDQEQPKLMIKSYDWEGEIPESRFVILKNKFGSIRSRNNSDKKIFIHANYQMIGENPLKPEFKITENKDYLEIEVLYADKIRDKNGQLRGRTDVAILFPDDVNIYAETDSGLIKIDKTASHVEAVSNSGEIKLTTTGLFFAKSQSGNISLRLRGQKQLGQSQAVSVTGSIKAEGVSLNNEQKKPELVYQQGNNSSNIEFYSEQGSIQLNVIQPPALVSSVKASNVVSVDVDLRDLEKAKMWKPGDPIYDRDDRRDTRGDKK